MNKKEFYDKINDMYDKGTYLEKYGLQVILAGLIVVIVFSSMAYTTMRKNESEIAHNWGKGNAKDEQGRYIDPDQTGPDYKCDPRFAPLAGFMSGKIQNTPQEETYDAAFAAGNFTECVTDTLQGFTLSLFNPFLLIASMTHTNLGNFTDSMSGIMDLVPRIRRQVAIFIQSIFNKLGMFVAYVRKFVYKISDMYQRGIGIVGISLYIFETIFYQIVAMAQLIISVINNWLEAVVIILLNLLVVAVVGLLILVPVIIGSYYGILGGIALFFSGPWGIIPAIIILAIMVTLWVGAIVTSVVLFLILPTVLIALIFYALFILIPVESLIGLFPSYIKPDPGAALALKKGKEKHNSVGLLKYLFPPAPNPASTDKPDKPASPPAGAGDTFTGKIAAKLRHCFDKDTLITMDNGKQVPISTICLGDVLHDNSTVTGIYKAFSHKQQMYRLNNVVVTGEHMIRYNEEDILVRDHPESIRINRYSKRYLYCISTTSKNIEINDMVFADWDELTEGERQKLGVASIHKELEGGFEANTNIKLQDREICIKDIKLGDTLCTGEKVLGIMKIHGKTTNCFEYTLNKSKVVGGPNLMYQNENLGIASTKDIVNKRRVDIDGPLYHIVTDTTMVPINDTLFFDYQSCLDNLL